jgi:murein DD-endopeptidase MepM/ murein hydrolase activator NlpD
MKKISITILIIFVSIGFLVYLKIKKDQARIVPADAVNIVFPLKDGPYKITQSGRSWTAHKAAVEKYAVDIIRKDDYSPFSFRSKFQQSGLETSATYNTPVYSSCRGVVRETEQNFSDMPIGIKGKANQTNYVIIACDGFNIFLAHFKKDSVEVRKDELVKVGQRIGLVGNSGYSDAPHLHIHAFKFAQDNREKIPLPILFEGKYLIKGDIYP